MNLNDGPLPERSRDFQLQSSLGGINDLGGPHVWRERLEDLEEARIAAWYATFAASISILALAGPHRIQLEIPVHYIHSRAEGPKFSMKNIP
jgi:hypothetical protein